MRSLSLFAFVLSMLPTVALAQPKGDALKPTPPPVPKVCDSKDPSACPQVARAALEERNDKAAAQAFKVMSAACDTGHLPSCTFVGLAALRGTGMKVDEKKAKRLLSKACDGGEAAACGGKMVIASHERDAELDKSREACKKGNAKACYAVGDALKGGPLAGPFLKAACEGNYQMGCIAYQEHLKERAKRDEAEAARRAASQRPATPPPSGTQPASAPGVGKDGVMLKSK